MMDIVDFHSHIIPRADHGSSSVETTISQLKLAQKSSVTRIIATPHFYPSHENVDTFIERRDMCYSRLAERMTPTMPHVKLGAEVLICDNIEEMPMLDMLCIGDSKALLLELPFTDFSESYVRSVRALIMQGYTIILAHADRYDKENIDRLIAAGAVVQLNAHALSGLYIPMHIRKWLDAGKVYAIGSDIHGVDIRAYKRFSRAIKKLGDNASKIKEYSDAIWCQEEK